MLRRLLDRLAQFVNVEPTWAGMWDTPLPGDEFAAPPAGAAIDCIVAGCRWGDWRSQACECFAGEG